jgi:hypothetical protein
MHFGIPAAKLPALPLDVWQSGQTELDTKYDPAVLQVRFDHLQHFGFEAAEATHQHHRLTDLSELVRPIAPMQHRCSELSCAATVMLMPSVIPELFVGPPLGVAVPQQQMAEPSLTIPWRLLIVDRAVVMHLMVRLMFRHRCVTSKATMNSTEQVEEHLGPTRWQEDYSPGLYQPRQDPRFDSAHHC